MLINGNDITETTKANICIIGSGVGGGTLAMKLSENNIPFTIVEAGDLSGNSDIVCKEHVGQDFGLRTTTSIQLGGTSNLWHGVLSPLDEIDFEQRDWIPNSGWPIGYKDLNPYYKEASDLLGIKDYEYFSLNELSTSLSEELKALSFDREFLKNKIFQQPLPPKNYKTDVIQITRSSDKYHCLYNSAALSLQFTEDGEGIESLTFGSKDGGIKAICADLFIVCAGALETPRLLLNSKRLDGSQPGNSGDAVGRYLMDHPMGNLRQIKFNTPQKAPIYSDIKYKGAIKIKSGLELDRNKQRELSLANHNFFIRPSFVAGIDDESEKIKLSLLTLKDGGFSFKDLFNVFSNLNVIRQIITYKMSLNVTYKFADLFFVTEQFPNPDSRVSLSDKKDRFGFPIAKINWNLLPQDIEGMKSMFDLIETDLFSHHNYTLSHVKADFNWDKIYTSAVHHVGTARMSDSEENGVVDLNQKVHGVNNLYVSDGSIFTTAGNVNSSLTIAAFSCRLAHYLSK